MPRKQVYVNVKTVCSCQRTLGSQYSISSGFTEFYAVTGLYVTYPADRQAAQRAADTVAARHLPSSFSSQTDSNREPSTSLVSACWLSNKCLLSFCPLQVLLPPSIFVPISGKSGWTTKHAEGQQNLQGFSALLGMLSQSEHRQRFLRWTPGSARYSSKSLQRKLQKGGVQVAGDGSACRRQAKTCQEQLKRHSSKVPTLITMALPDVHDSRHSLDHVSISICPWHSR